MYPYDTQPTQTVIPNRYGGIAYRPIPNQTGAGPIGVDQVGNNILPDWVNMQRAGYAQGQVNRYAPRSYGTPTRFLPEAEGGMRMIRSEYESVPITPQNYMDIRAYKWLKDWNGTFSAPMAQNAAMAVTATVPTANRYAQAPGAPQVMPPLPLRPMAPPETVQDINIDPEQYAAPGAVYPQGFRAPSSGFSFSRTLRDAAGFFPAATGAISSYIRSDQLKEDYREKTARNLMAKNPGWSYGKALSEAYRMIP